MPTPDRGNSGSTWRLHAAPHSPALGPGPGFWQIRLGTPGALLRRQHWAGASQKSNSLLAQAAAGNHPTARARGVCVAPPCAAPKK